MKYIKTFLFVLLLSGVAFSETAVEGTLGISSPNKGLLGIRYSPMPFSFGPIWGSFANYSDFGIAGSFHFTGYKGFYLFQSHHWLHSSKSTAKNIWEINTGAGYQYLIKKAYLIYAEFGIPVYIGGGRVHRYYKEGAPYNRDPYDPKEVIFVSFRAGIGLGYVFTLW